MNICEQAHKDIELFDAETQDKLKKEIVDAIGKEYEQFLESSSKNRFAMPTCFLDRTLMFTKWNNNDHINFDVECNYCGSNLLSASRQTKLTTESRYAIALHIATYYKCKTCEKIKTAQSHWLFKCYFYILSLICSIKQHIPRHLMPSTFCMRCYNYISKGSKPHPHKYITHKLRQKLYERNTRQSRKGQ